MGDALALRGDEGRDKLRKVTGSSTHALIRKYLNGSIGMMVAAASAS